MRQLSTHLLLILCCHYHHLAAASLHHSSLQRTTSLSSIAYAKTKSPHQQKYHAFFRVPRGGGDDNADTKENQSVAKDLYYQELSEQIILSDDTTTSSEEIELVWDSEDCDVEAFSSTETDDDVTDENEPLDDPIIDPLGTEAEERIIPRFLSPQHLTTTLPSNLIHFANMVIQVARRSLVAGARAIMVENVDETMDRQEVEDQEERRPVVRTLVGKTVFVLGEMYHAAKTTTTTPDDVEKHDGGNRIHRRRRRRAVAVAGSPSRRRRRHRKRERYTTSPTEVVCNGGGMEPRSSNKNALLNLAQQHNINLPTDNDNTALPKKYDSILLNSQTPLSAALQKSNSDARFLICYISKKKKDTTKKSDSIALSSLLSPEVVKLINRRPLGKKQSDNTGSYYVWIMNGDDGAAAKEIDMAMKRLKVKPPASNSKKSSSKKKKEDGPILAIFYPATTVDSSGKLKVTPRLLAQHHCHPPPSSPEVMMNWANTIRKRHIREFAKLQHDRKEMQLLRERTEGYKESMKEDKARAEREERELQAKKEAEEKERLRLEKLEQRRQELLETLPEEPEAGSEGVITIALRFGDGSRDQRRFVAEETSVNELLNWVDATHGMEREKIELSTMNGSKTFVYVEEDDDDEQEESGNVTLDEAGLGKMTALRVTEIVQEVDNGEEEEEDESDSTADE
eukprot:scaffold2572_cov75-Skeletonema_marinoi.AAC.6